MVPGQFKIGMSGDRDMMRYTNVSLKDCIRNAYRVKDFQIEGPDWLESQRFDISAKLPDGASQDQIPQMLQLLLAERFKLTLHRDKKEHTISALVVGKNGPKLTPVEAPNPDEPPTRNGVPRGAMTMRYDPAGMHLSASRATLANVADLLSRVSERPVVDMTGIEGVYAFDFVFAPEQVRGLRTMGGGAMPGGGAGDHAPPVADASDEGAAGSIQAAVQKYGLKLEGRKAPMEILIIDHMERTPTEN